jgi:hypothetical protein
MSRRGGTFAKLKLLRMRGALRRGPCIAGGVSPSLHLAPQSVTGPIFTGLPQPLPAVSQYGFLEPETAGRGEVASSGSPQSQDPTKESRLAPLAFIPFIGREAR